MVEKGNEEVERDKSPPRKGAKEIAQSTTLTNSRKLYEASYQSAPGRSNHTTGDAAAHRGAQHAKIGTHIRT